MKDGSARGGEAGAVTGRGDAGVAPRSGNGEIEAFLDSVARTVPAAGAGRLIFALDATMSRQPTWDLATELQAEMFDEALKAGGLAVSLVYFRGLGECRASRWVSDSAALKSMMARIDCRAGHTQIGRVLTHAVETARENRVAALVYVGDAMEENPDDLAAAAGELALLGVRTFLFQEGHDPVAERTFREIARVTGGAHVRFEPGAARRLGELLRAVAAYAAGGLKALTALSGRGGEGARLLIAAMPGGGGAR
ncbi:VWA domain-containing protein [Prosthecomicrobium sp. N25]|uniref:VWA domain-containing protein n=1 Tax=Prosthecomicrobium sp. N25 TaxID=3129254 RepID=UPI0030784AD0